MTRYAPLWQQAGSYPSQLDRYLMGALWPIGGKSAGAVTAVNNTMNVSIAPGNVAVPLQAGQGAALCHWDAAEVVTLAAAPGAGTSRIDLIVCQVRDAALDGGGNNDFVFAAVTGVPAASPGVPAVPTNALAVATVTVPATVANLNTAVIAPMCGNVTPAHGVLAFPTLSTNQNNITANVDVVGLVAVLNIAPGQRIKISAGCAYISAPLPPSDQYGFYLYEDATNVQVAFAPAGGSPAPLIVRTPTPGLHTYKVQVGHAAGGTPGVLSASAVSPVWMLIEDAGAA